MSFLGIGGGGNLFGSIANIALQGALGVMTGGASLMVTTALKTVMTAIGDQVLQQIGQKLGLPQGAIDLAQAAFHTAAGDPGGAVQNISEAAQGLGSAAGLSQFETGEIERQAFDGAQFLRDQTLDQLQGGTDAEGKPRGKSALAGASGESFLVKLAIALGSVVDSKMDKMVAKAGEIDKAGSGGKSQTAKLTAELSALGQEVNMISTALNNAIKSLGESASTLARKS
jgi:hypothetical protein